MQQQIEVLVGVGALVVVNLLLFHLQAKRQTAARRESGFLLCVPCCQFKKSQLNRKKQRSILGNFPAENISASYQRVICEHLTQAAFTHHVRRREEVVENFAIMEALTISKVKLNMVVVVM